MSDNMDMNDDNLNLNIRVITENADVIEFEATPEEAEEIRTRIRSSYDNDSWGWIRIVKEDGRIEGVSIDEMCCVRIRPYGRGEQFPDSKFVQFQFAGGGYLRAVCEASQTVSLEHLLDESEGGLIEWNAGAHEIFIRSEAILHFVIDRHEERQRQPHFDYDDGGGHEYQPRQYRNNNGGGRNGRFDHRDNRRNNDRRRSGGGRSDRRPHSARAY